MSDTKRVNSSFGTSSSSFSNPNQQIGVSQLNQFQQFQAFNGGGRNRIGAPPSHPNPNPNPIPPISPHCQIPATLQPISENFNPGSRHSRSMSQPSSFFSFDSLPVFNPSPLEERNGNSGFSLPPSPFTMCQSSSSSSSSKVISNGENLPPRKSHRRSNSDNIPFGFSSLMDQKLPPLIPSRSLEISDWSNLASLVKEEPNNDKGNNKSSEGETMDDIFSAYMNLDNIEVLNSLGSEHIKEEIETNGESCSDSEEQVKISVKRRASKDIAPTSRHHKRSVSMDSCFMEKLNFNEDSSLKPLKLSSTGNLSAKVSPSSSADGNSSGFNVEFGNTEFTAMEIKKIKTDEKLAEIAMTDPKRVKKILANRQSAARSKERKMRYIAELEHKVQTLQTETTTLSAQLTHLQRDSMGLTSQNSELKFRIQAMEQQALLRDALKDRLSAEVQRLRMVNGEAISELEISKRLRNEEVMQFDESRNGGMKVKDELGM